MNWYRQAGILDELRTMPHRMQPKIDRNPISSGINNPGKCYGCKKPIIGTPHHMTYLKPNIKAYWCEECGTKNKNNRYPQFATNKMNWYRQAEYSITNFDNYQNKVNRSPKLLDKQKDERLRAEIEIIVSRYFKQKGYSKLHQHPNRPDHRDYITRRTVPVKNVQISPTYKEDDLIGLNVHVVFANYSPVTFPEDIRIIETDLKQRRIHKEIQELTGVEPDITYSFVSMPTER